MIHLAIAPPGYPPREKYDAQMVEIQIDLQDFLCTLSAFPDLAKLGELDYYSRTKIGQDWVDRLSADISVLLERLGSRSIRIIAPDAVGTNCDEETPMGFGLEGFVKWANAVLALAKRAQAMNIPIWAIGN